MGIRYTTLKPELAGNSQPPDVFGQRYTKSVANALPFLCAIFFPAVDFLLPVW